MKLDVAVNEVTLSNTGASGEFKIRNSAKAFKILSDGLYSNKKRAIIRELSCNALDSHVAAGKKDVPFEVHLPTVLEPWFAVRDFGLGLNGDQVMNIYTTYFESTKTDSNDFIGALGLGSKSPFSYTENFTVTAIKDGFRRIYSAYINEMGVPCVTEMSEELTDEVNGVEVKFSVTDRWDYDSFRHEARSVFSWFENQPIITGVTDFQIRPQEYKEKNIVKGVHTWHERSSMALMGNIAYPLNKVPEPRKYFGDLAGLLDCGLVLEFDIGELDFAASREELSYVPMTLNSIKRKLEDLNANLALHLSTKANAITCEWERAEYLCSEVRSPLYAAAVKKYAIDNKFELFDATRYDGRKEFDFPSADLDKKGLTITGVRTYNGMGSRITEYSQYTAGAYVKSMRIPVDTEVVIVLNDLKTGCLTRARYHYVNHNNGKAASVYCISHNDPDQTVRQLIYDEFLKGLHNPPTVVKASSLKVQTKIKAATKQGIMMLKGKMHRYNGSTESYTWSPVDSAFEFDDNTTYHYVALNNYDTQTLEGEHFNMFGLKAQMDRCGVKTLADIEIYGVRKSVLKEIKALPNWVWVEEKIKEETAKISDKDIEAAVAVNMFDRYSDRLYINQTISKLVGPKSDYAKFASLHANVKVNTSNGYSTGQDIIANLVNLCGTYGKSVKVDEIRKTVTEAKGKVQTKYPLMDYLQSAPEALIADYIKTIDKLEKT